LIIGNEYYSYKELEKTIQRLRPDYSLAGQTEDVVGAIDFLNSHTVDLIFTDVQLSDGLCMDVFQSTACKTPVIVTTAYREYATQLQGMNVIDFLLKPVSEIDVKKALIKFETNCLPEYAK
jgi:two-component system response regulator LytT